MAAEPSSFSDVLPRCANPKPLEDLRDVIVREVENRIHVTCNYCITDKQIAAGWTPISYDEIAKAIGIARVQPHDLLNLLYQPLDDSSLRVFAVDRIRASLEYWRARGRLDKANSHGNIYYFVPLTRAGLPPSAFGRIVFSTLNHTPVEPFSTVSFPEVYTAFGIAEKLGLHKDKNNARDGSSKVSQTLRQLFIDGYVGRAKVFRAPSRGRMNAVFGYWGLDK